MTEGLEAWFRLTLQPGIGPAAQRALLAAFGLPEHIFAAGYSAIASVIGKASADALLAPVDSKSMEDALAWAAAPGNHVLTLADPAYPQILLEIADPPTLIYAKGDPEVLRMSAIAIVGARSATPQGNANAEAFARSLAGSGFAIISGLALGIDTAAHRGALAASGYTIAVVGTGADRVYPAANRALAHEIAANGLILSEFPLGTAPLPHNFPKRNRLIAGLAKGVLVVEAAVGSGSLITARLAAECGRDVLAIPGSIHSPLARGCHRLIRDGAKLVETAQDVLDELGGGPQSSNSLARRTAVRNAARRAETASSDATVKQAPEGEDALQLLAALGHDPVDIDTLVIRSGLTLDALYAILLPLELDGHVARLPGGRFQRL